MAKDEVRVGEKRRRGGARGACSGEGMEEENGSDQLGVGLLDPVQSCRSAGGGGGGEGGGS